MHCTTCKVKSHVYYVLCHAPQAVLDVRHLGADAAPLCRMTAALLHASHAAALRALSLSKELLVVSRWVGCLWFVVVFEVLCFHVMWRCGLSLPWVLLLDVLEHVHACTAVCSGRFSAGPK